MQSSVALHGSVVRLIIIILIHMESFLLTALENLIPAIFCHCCKLHFSHHMAKQSSPSPDSPLFLRQTVSADEPFFKWSPLHGKFDNGWVATYISKDPLIQSGENLIRPTTLSLKTHPVNNNQRPRDLQGTRHIVLSIWNFSWDNTMPVWESPQLRAL